MHGIALTHRLTPVGGRSGSGRVGGSIYVRRLSGIVVSSGVVQISISLTRSSSRGGRVLGSLRGFRHRIINYPRPIRGRNEVKKESSVERFGGCFHG